MNESGAGEKKLALLREMLGLAQEQLSLAIREDWQEQDAETFIRLVQERRELRQEVDEIDLRTENVRAKGEEARRVLLALQELDGRIETAASARMKEIKLRLQNARSQKKGYVTYAQGYSPGEARFFDSRK